MLLNGDVRSRDHLIYPSASEQGVASRFEDSHSQ